MAAAAAAAPAAAAPSGGAAVADQPAGSADHGPPCPKRPRSPLCAACKLDAASTAELMALPPELRDMVMAGKLRQEPAAQVMTRLQQAKAAVEAAVRRPPLPVVPRDPALDSRRPPFGYFTDRYYTTIPVEAPGGGDQYVALHSNNLCVVGVRPTHPALAGGRVVRVDFPQSRSGKDRGEVHVQGKRKRGALFCQENTVLCEAVLGSGERVKVASCIRGTLIEINERLAAEPELLRRFEDDGWVGILKPTQDQRQFLERRIREEGLGGRRQGEDVPDGD
eukprot:TRINITY_DN29652_c0_g1_i1.p1 TRINITY_DN29652_c0_g1~~TRINITY_DN29652_c0_g1_i1.p1  ORF type:complete len:302 (+),score=57.00 TRINITY_DN29652_c0_g1_i1:71-907(+)